MQYNVASDVPLGSSPPGDTSRRSFMKQAGGFLEFALASPLASPAEPTKAAPVFAEGLMTLTLRINGKARTLQLEPRVTLLIYY